MQNKLRKNIRFSPDDNTLSIVDFDQEVSFYGLATTEALKGFSAVFVKTNEQFLDYFYVGSTCAVILGKLDESPYIIRWVTEIKENIYQVGFELLG